MSPYGPYHSEAQYIAAVTSEAEEALELQDHIATDLSYAKRQRISLEFQAPFTQ